MSSPPFYVPDPDVGFEPVVSGLSEVDVTANETIFPFANLSVTNTNGTTVSAYVAPLFDNRNTVSFNYSGLDSVLAGDSALVVSEREPGNFDVDGDLPGVIAAIRSLGVDVTLPTVGSSQGTITVGITSGYELGEGVSVLHLGGPAVALTGVPTAAEVGGVATSVLNGIVAAGASTMATTVTVSLTGDVRFAGLFEGSGQTATYTATGADLSAMLRTLQLVSTSTAAGPTTGSLTVTISSGGTTLSGSEALTIDPVGAQAYSYLGTSGGTASYAVLDRPGATANLDLGAATGPVNVFGNVAAADITLNNGTVVLNGAGTYGDTTVTGASDTASNVIWAGQSNVTVAGSGHSQTVLTGGPGLQGSLTVSTTGISSADVDVWGAAGTTQTVTTNGAGPTLLFGGASDLDFTGGRSTLILNGSATGAATIHSTGDDTVWAGNGGLTFYEGADTDTLYLTGSATNATVVGNSDFAALNTKIDDLGVGAGNLTLIGGDKFQDLTLSQTNATVFGGNSFQILTQNGSGSLTVVNGNKGGNFQDIKTSQGRLTFWGGSNEADIALGSGDAYVNAGFGNISLTGGSGHLTLDLAPYSSTTLNVNGATSGDVDVFGYASVSKQLNTLNVTDVLSQTASNGSTVMLLGDGARITLHDYVAPTS